MALCGAIVAEVIPHFRPDIFKARFLARIAARNTPVRISGQLFFDAAHRPCEGTVPQDSSVRGSLWEIHPVYSIDVCKHKTLQQCPAASEAAWVPLDQSIGMFEMLATRLMSLFTSEEDDDDEDRKDEHLGE